MDATDPQQFRFYRMEREEIGARDYARMTFKACGKVARSVCRAYSIPQATLKKRVMGTWAAEYDYVDESITLNPKKGTATDLLTILHELAHHVHYHMGGSKYEDHANHGKEFVACYISVLDTVRLIPSDAMAVICKRRRIAYIPPGPSIRSLKRAIR